MSEAPDLLITGGRLFVAYTPRDLTPYGSDIGPRPVAAPNAIAVRGGQIAWIGRDDEGLRDWRGPKTEVVDARGGLITAGFEDAHVHLLDGSLEADWLDLFHLPSLAAIGDAVRRHAAANAAERWILARGWMYDAFDGRLPTAAMLDAVVPDRPAYLGCYDGHTAWVNTAALRAAGIDRDTPDPPRGSIVRDPATGEATGALKEDAQDLVTRLLPKPSRAEAVAAMRRSIAAMQATGITAIQDAWVEPDEVATWRKSSTGGPGCAPGSRSRCAPGRA